MNPVLFKSSARSLLKLWLIFAAVMALYVIVITTMFDPELNATLDAIIAAMPELMSMAGMQAGSSTLSGFLANYLYGFLLLIFPLVFTGLAANRLISARVDSGSMAYLLASPNTRVRVARTQALVLIAGNVITIVFATVLAIVCAEVMFPRELEVGRYIILNVGLLCLHLAIIGFCFFASCQFNESKYSLALGSGLPVLCFLFQMLANVGDKLEKFKYISIFTLFEPYGLLEGTTAAYTGAAILLCVGLLLYTVGIAVFDKRDLPL